ncbi:MAG: hypothetical protein ACXW50_19415, partial [Candidatus Binatia bacterium]
MEPWSDDFRNKTFSRELGLAIAVFGEAAVPKLAPFLQEGPVDKQREVFHALQSTSCVAAGTVILDWLLSLKPDRSPEHYSRIAQGLRALAILKDVGVMPILSQVINVEPNWAIEPLILLDTVEAWSLLDTFVQSNASIYERRRAAAQMSPINPTYEALHRSPTV